MEKNNKIKVSISTPLELDSSDKIEDITEEMEEDINELCEDIELNEETYSQLSQKDEELPDLSDETKNAIESLEDNLDNQETNRLSSDELDISIDPEKLDENIVDSVLNNK